MTNWTISKCVAALVVGLAVHVAPAAAGGDDWLHFGYDSTFTSHNPSESQITTATVSGLERAWGVGCDDGYFSVISGSPAVHAGTLYTSGAGSRLSAYDARSGGLLWQFGDGNLGWAPQPVVTGDGTVVFYMEGSLPTQLYAVNAATGAQLWQAPLGFDLGFNDTAVPVVDEARDLVYVVEDVFAPCEGKLYALDLDSGEISWYMSKQTHTVALTGDHVLLDGGDLYVAAEIPEGQSCRDHVVRVNPDSQQVTTTYARPQSAEYHDVHQVTLCDDRLVVGYDYQYDDVKLLTAYDPDTGTVLWQKETTEVTGSLACNETAGRLYVPTDPHLLALDVASGNEAWRYTGYDVIYSPSVAGGIVYLISDTNMYALDEATGQRLFSYPLGYEGYETTQVAIADGMAFFSGNGGTCDLFALSLSGTSPGSCVPSATQLCLNERFRVTATWETATGQSGVGNAARLTGDTGYFWFFSSSNVEVVIKVLDACTISNNHWVFAGGLTDVEVEITVEDTATGETRTYVNPQSTAFQPIQDTSAFATCP